MEKIPLRVAFFYCRHQAGGANRLLRELPAAAEMEIRQVALPCSGKLEVFHLLQALESGSAGAALFACPEEKCRFLVGSTRAKGRIRQARKLLEEIGLGGDRVERFVLEEPAPREVLDSLRDWVERVKALASRSDPEGASPKEKSPAVL